MMNKIRGVNSSELLQNCMYSKDTYNLLNYLTLDIKNPEIQRKFDHQRCQNFKTLFLPMIALYAFILIFVVVPFKWREFFTGGSEQDYIQLAIFIIWAVMH